MFRKLFFVFAIAAAIVVLFLVREKGKSDFEIKVNETSTSDSVSASVSPSLLPSDRAGKTDGELDSSERIIVNYTDSGYSPNVLKVKKGDTVVFKNLSSKLMWTASAIHPTHTVYPGSDIRKCGTEQEKGIFDACRGYGQNEEWSFVFNEIGTWRYHNHLMPGDTGTIIVEK